MFERAIFETVEAAPRTRTWTTMISFAMQMVAVGMLILLPLIYTEAIPNLHISEAPTVPPAPRAPKPVEVFTEHHGTIRNVAADPSILVAPGRIPINIDRTPDPPREPLGGGDIDAATGVPGGDPNATARQLQNWARNMPPPPPVVPKHTVETTRVRPSVLLEGYLVRRVEPVYPTPARIAHIQGPVVLKAIIDAEGRVQHLQAVSGHPMLLAAAVNAVKEWRYRPYVLNGTPIEVETQVTVIFTLR